MRISPKLFKLDGIHTIILGGVSKLLKSVRALNSKELLTVCSNLMIERIMIRVYVSAEEQKYCPQS